MSDSVQPHRRQPTRLPRPWDSPGKNTGVGCHFLLQCMKGKGESEVAQLCSTRSDRVDCSLPGSSVHGIFQARVLEWAAIAFCIPLLVEKQIRPTLWELWLNCMHRKILPVNFTTAFLTAIIWNTSQLSVSTWGTGELSKDSSLVILKESNSKNY